MDGILCPECGTLNPVEAVVCESCSAELAAVKSVMDTANSHYNEALALAHSGRLDEAIGQLEAALALTAHNANYHHLLGTIYAQKGLFSEAIRAWERCISLDGEVEKAYRNIEKAKRMEEEGAEEQRQRPFLLASIGAGVAAAIFLVATAYFGVSGYFKSSQIASLNEQLTQANTDLATWKTQYQSISKVIPADGINGLLQEIEKTKALAEDRAKQIEDTKTQYQRVVDRRQEQIQKLSGEIQELRNQIAAKDQEIQKVNQLESVINSNKMQQARQEQQLKETQDELEKEKTRANELKEKLVVSQNTSDSIKQDKERSLANLKKEQEKMTEDLRNQTLQLRDEIAGHERRYSDLKYAGQLVVECLKNLDNNQFDLAFQNVQNALARSADSAACVYLQGELQRILNDPLEQELRRQETLQRAQQREAKRSELVESNLKRARESQSSGDFDQAIDLAQRVVALTTDPQKQKDGEEILHQAQEEKNRLAMQLLEAESFLQQQNTKEAEAILKKVLKRSPSNARAKDLLKQVTQPAEKST